MKLPFAREIPLMTPRPSYYGWYWHDLERSRVMIAPLGLHLIYGGLHTLYLLWLLGFTRINYKLAKGQQIEELAKALHILRRFTVVGKQIMQSGRVCQICRMAGAHDTLCLYEHAQHFLTKG